MRYRTLDSVRGLAALVVVLFHLLMTFPGGGEHRSEILASGLFARGGWIYATPLRLLVSGPGAVLLFFVLSGFVLTLSLRSSTPPSAGAFAISRVARIWLPFAAAILLSALLSYFLKTRGAPEVSLAFSNVWKQPLTFGGVARHLLMTGSAMDLDGVMWSLIHELRISLIFPLLMWLTVRYHIVALIGSAALTIAAAWLVGHTDVGHLKTFIQTATYVYFFIIGILLAQYADKIRELLGSLSFSYLAGLWIIALAILTFAPEDTSLVDTLGNGALLLLSGIGAALIISLSIIGGRADRLLLSGWSRFLGRISYSLYLTHAIVITAFVRAMGGLWPLSVTVAFAFALTILAANLFQRAIEAPSQRLGKMLAAQFDKWRAANATFWNQSESPSS